MANILERFAGKLCEVLLPVKEDIFFGNQCSTVAVCTLSSIDLLKKISSSESMQKVAIAARLFSENKGIVALIKYVLKHKVIKYIILCGKDTRGHSPGQALLALHEKGVDEELRIIGADGKDPTLDGLTAKEIEEFRKYVVLIDLIGTTDMEEISEQISKA